MTTVSSVQNQNRLAIIFGIAIAAVCVAAETILSFCVRFFVLFLFFGLTGAVLFSSGKSLLQKGQIYKIQYSASVQNKNVSVVFLQQLSRIGDNRDLAQTVAGVNESRFTLSEEIIDPYAHRMAQIEQLESLLSQSPRSVPVMDSLIALYRTVNNETYQKSADELQKDRQFVQPQ